MRTEIIRIGNSRGIRIPKPLLEQAGLSGTVRLVAEEGRLIIQRDRSPREGWSEAIAAAARPEKDFEELRNISNKFDCDDWTW